MKLCFKNPKLLDANYCARQMDVLVEGDRIAAVEEQITEADRFVDLTGCTLLPGFIDAHVHVAVSDEGFREDAVRAWAYNGVTTVRELGMLSTLPQEDYARWIDENNRDPRRARVIAAGKYIDVAGGYGAGPVPGHPVGHLITTAEEAAQRVEQARDDGFAGIKIGIHDQRMEETPHLTAEMAAAICQRASSLGMWTAAHIGNCRGARFMLDAGIDELAHTPGDPMDEALIREMVARGIPMDTTVGAPDKQMPPPPPGMFPDFDPEEQNVRLREQQRIMVENLRRFHAAGGRIVVGTDLIHSRDYKKDAAIPVGELRQLAAAGLSLQEIIGAATYHAAQVVGTADEEGLIRPGMAANLVAIRGDVDITFSALADIALVMHRGVLIRNEIDG